MLLNRLKPLLALALAILGFVASAAAEPLPVPSRWTCTAIWPSRWWRASTVSCCGKSPNPWARRPRHWKRDVSSAEKYNASVAPNRAQLAKIIGAHDARPHEVTAVELVATTSEPALVGRGELRSVCRPLAGRARSAERRVVAGAEESPPVADVVADARRRSNARATWPAWRQGMAPESQFARRLAESGCRVLVPALIDRADTYSAIGSAVRRISRTASSSIARRSRWAGTSSATKCKRCWRRSIGSRTKPAASNAAIGVVGYGEGGLLALYAAALDTRIDAALVSGYFDSRQESVARADLSQRVRPARRVRRRRAGQPGCAASLDRRGLPRAAGRRSAAAARRPQQLGRARPTDARPAVATLQARTGSRPGALVSRLADAARLSNWSPATTATGLRAAQLALEKFLAALSTGCEARAAVGPRRRLCVKSFDAASPAAARCSTRSTTTRSTAARGRNHAGRALVEGRSCFARRGEVESQHDSSYRKHFYDEVIGRFEQDRCCRRTRARRQVYDEPLYTGYEVVLDVFPDVFAYGICWCPRTSSPASGGRSSSASTGWKGGRTTWPTRRRSTRPTTSTPAGWPSAASSFMRRRTRTSSTTSSARCSARPTRWARRCSRSSCRSTSRSVDWLATLPHVDPAADRLLRPVLRRQDGDARAGAGRALLPVDLLGRLQRVGLEERLDQLAVQLRDDRRVRDLRVRPGQHVQLRRDGA